MLILVAVTSCSNDESNLDPHSIVSVKLKGASEDTKQLLLDIEQVQLLVGDNEFDASSWLTLNTINTGVQNVSKFAEGTELLLVDNTVIPSGEIRKIKLVLGVNNTIIIDNKTTQLVSYNDELASSNVIKTTLGANNTYEFIMEFEVDNSVIIANDTMEFRPEMNTMMRHINRF